MSLLRANPSFIPKLFVLCLLSQALPAQNLHEQLVGSYHGEVFNGSDMDPVVTTFRVDEYGRLSGEYSVDEENGAYSGVLSSLVFDDERTLSMEWTDKFGEGFAIMEFSRDFESFTGAWSDKQGSRDLPWSGRKGGETTTR